MQKIALTLICFLTLNFAVFAQSNFDLGFNAGFKSGYCYSSQYSVYCTPPFPPFPPSPQINESSSNYQDGYDRGFLYGTDKRKADDNNSSNQRASRTNPPKFSPYVPQLPINEMVNSGISRQKIYDQRYAWIQSRISSLINAIYDNVTEDNFPSLNIEASREYLKRDLNNYVNSYNVRSSDFADNYKFQNIVNNLNIIERNIAKKYETFLLNKRKEEIALSKFQDNEEKKSLQNQLEKDVTIPSAFNSYLNKEIGTYSCKIYHFKLNKEDKKYRSVESYNGFLEIDSSSCIYFKGNSIEWNSRCLTNKTINFNNKYNYETSAGDVILDYDTNEVIFYNEGETDFYKYVIGNEYKFSSKFISNNIGSYCCQVSFFELKNHKYVKSLTRSGYVDIFDTSIIFLDNLQDCDGEISIDLEENTMSFIDEVFEKDKLEYSYNFKTVVIDNDFKNIKIYSPDKKSLRVFTIIRNR